MRKDEPAYEAVKLNGTVVAVGTHDACMAWVGPVGCEIAEHARGDYLRPLGMTVGEAYARG